MANQLAIKWINALHAAEISILGRSKNVILVENNQSGQFARYLRAKPASPRTVTSAADGEPFMPHHCRSCESELAGRPAFLSYS